MHGLGRDGGRCHTGRGGGSGQISPVEHFRPRFSLRVLDSYKKAIRATLALPPTDPFNWYRYTLIHTLDCPHGNWWFLPWHRGYTGWFEQICRDLSGDPQFALPYWDWTKEPRVPKQMFEDVLNPNDPAFTGRRRRVQDEIHRPCLQGHCWSLARNPDGKAKDRRRSLVHCSSDLFGFQQICGSTCSTVRRGASSSTSQTRAA